MTVHSSLQELMEFISQKYFGVEWQDGLEFYLWREAQGRALPKNSALLDPAERGQLESFSRRENCWFTQDDSGKIRKVSLTEWESIYEEEFGSE